MNLPEGLHHRTIEFDVFQQFDPDNLLLDQAKREVLDQQLQVQRLRESLDRLQTRSLLHVATEHLTPLSFPLWADRMREQHVSSETWQQRIERMVGELEKAADK